MKTPSIGAIKLVKVYDLDIDDKVRISPSYIGKRPAVKTGTVRGTITSGQGKRLYLVKFRGSQPGIWLREDLVKVK